MTPARALLAAAVVAIALGGCANPWTPKEGGEPLDLGVPGEVVAIHEGVGYYPACGNEVLSFDGKSWFPYDPANLGDFPSVDAQASPSVGLAHGGLARAVPTVAAPGPGDDTGRLTVYEGDIAYWVSDSGTLSTWLTNHELTYNWVC